MVLFDFFLLIFFKEGSRLELFISQIHRQIGIVGFLYAKWMLCTQIFISEKRFFRN